MWFKSDAPEYLSKYERGKGKFRKRTKEEDALDAELSRNLKMAMMTALCIWNPAEAARLKMMMQTTEKFGGHTAKSVLASWKFW